MVGLAGGRREESGGPLHTRNGLTLIHGHRQNDPPMGLPGQGRNGLA